MAETTLAQIEDSIRGRTLVREELDRITMAPFFIGESLRSVEEQQFLLGELSKFVNTNRLKQTKLLYAFPQMAKLPYHEHVDKHDHFVMVIRMQNFNTIAFYSARGLDKKVYGAG